MAIKDYTLRDEKIRLENFLRKENIEVNHNYLRMEKGPKPILFRAMTLSHQLRFRFLQHYFLIFTQNCLILLFQDEDYEYRTKNMIKISYKDIQNFSFQKKYGDYCLFFEHLDIDYYFYLTDRLSSRLLDKIFHLSTQNYSYSNLTYLREMNFMGLSKKET